MMDETKIKIRNKGLSVLSWTIFIVLMLILGAAFYGASLLWFTTILVIGDQMSYSQAFDKAMENGGGVVVIFFALSLAVGKFLFWAANKVMDKFGF